MRASSQKYLFDPGQVEAAPSDGASSTFLDNMRLPVHRWFRYSAGFSGRWAEAVIAEHAARDNESA